MQQLKHLIQFLNLSSLINFFNDPLRFTVIFVDSSLRSFLAINNDLFLN